MNADPICPQPRSAHPDRQVHQVLPGGRQRPLQGQPLDRGGVSAPASASRAAAGSRTAALHNR